MSPTEEMLLARCGGSPLMSIQQLAEVLHRSAEGLRVCIRGNDKFSERLRVGRVKIGRRVYFRLTTVAEIIDESGP